MPVEASSSDANSSEDCAREKSRPRNWLGMLRLASDEKANLDSLNGAGSVEFEPVWLCLPLRMSVVEGPEEKASVAVRELARFSAVVWPKKPVVERFEREADSELFLPFEGNPLREPLTLSMVLDPSVIVVNFNNDISELVVRILGDARMRCPFLIFKSLIIDLYGTSN